MKRTTPSLPRTTRPPLASRPRRRAINRLAPWVERRAYDASGLVAADRKQLFPIIARVVRSTLGHCIDASRITPEQRQLVCTSVAEQAAAAGFKRLTSKTIAGRVDFWLKVSDPAKALWFNLNDLSRANAIVTALIPHERLDAFIAEHARQLEGRTLDHFVLALGLCGIVKNTLVANRKTRKGECGTKSLRMLLKSSGFSANGSFASLIFKLLAASGLLRCTDAGFEIGKRCRRWTPSGLAWSIPFVAGLPDTDLSDEQRTSRNAFLGHPADADKSDIGRSYRIRSSPSDTTPLTTNQGQQQQQQQTRQAESGSRDGVIHHEASKVGRPHGVLHHQRPEPDFYCYAEEDILAAWEVHGDDWGPDIEVSPLDLPTILEALCNEEPATSPAAAEDEDHDLDLNVDTFDIGPIDLDEPGDEGPVINTVEACRIGSTGGPANAPTATPIWLVPIETIASMEVAPFCWPPPRAASRSTEPMLPPF